MRTGLSERELIAVGLKLKSNGSFTFTIHVLGDKVGYDCVICVLESDQLFLGENARDVDLDRVREHVRRGERRGNAG
jgi:acetone carboxylase gamma subunit